MKETKYIIEKEYDLVKYLKEKNIAKNKIKTYIKLGFIYVNNKKITKLPFLLHKKDVIKIKKENYTQQNLEILYETNNYLIVNKEAGLLTISTGTKDKTTEQTLYKIVREYLNQKKEKCFIVNRIDKETSGIVIFAKAQKLKEQLQENWNELVTDRGYIAVVTGKITKPGRIDNYLYEDKMTFSHSTKVGGKRAITNYIPIKISDKYTMLDIHIETGRKNQIRVHMSEMNHPILGDKKYGCKENPIKRLLLHHYKISFKDPITNKLLTINKEVPKEFYDLFNKH